MPDTKDTVLGRLAVERGYLSQEQLDEALETQRKAREELGMDQPLVQVLLGKHLLSADQAQELRNATAMETGEARLVAGYEVVSKLGQGGMGAVYRAKSQTTGQFVALKILPPSLATDELVRRFEREAEVVSKLNHKHIVGCVEFGFDPRRKVHFCALELIEGEDLEKRIARLGVLPEAEAARITYQVAQALQHAFFNGLVHRDIKPPNVMVARDGTAKLLDLGLARSANMEVTRLTQTGAFVGSPYYASPEQATGESDIDIRSDIYSLGCTLYHMVTGKPPFGGTTVIQVLQKHLTEQMPWPQEANPSLSDGLCQIIAKMMAKSRADRYQDPKELLADLHTHLEGGEPEIGEAALKGSSVNVPIAVRRRVRERRRGARPGRDSGRRAPAEGPTDTRRRRRVMAEAGPDEKKGAPVAAIAGGVLAAALVIGMGVVMMGEKKKRPRPKAPPQSAQSTQETTDRDGGQGASSPAGQSPSSASSAVKDVDVRAAKPPPTLTLDLGGGVEMEMIYIKPGVFTMGGTIEVEPDHSWQGVEKPKHEVAITQGFYVGKYEVTQAQYEAVTGGNPSKSKDPDRPVEQVTWDDAAQFCRLAQEKTGRQFRLPTEAEWEFACRAGSTDRFCFGSDWAALGEYAWFGDNSDGQTHPVGRKRANAWGLHDMHGNIWEWVADWHGSDYYANSPRENPTGPDAGDRRIFRGGARGDGPPSCRSAFRGHHMPWHRDERHGFRAGVSLSPAEAAASRRAPARPANVPADAVEFGGRWYKLFTQEMKWHDAKAFCERQGGHLVTITRKEEQDFVVGLARGTRGFAWIGLSDEREEGKWEWVTGEPMAYVAWAPGEPSSETERYGNLCAHKGYLWNDGGPHGSYPFFCEWEAPSAAHPPNVPPDAVEFGGHRYKLFTEKMSWHDAKAFCERAGGHLVTITSKEENDFVTG
ncbi:MAG: protein kinase domain-containing protein, partial [Planctomycetota bacterium]